MTLKQTLLTIGLCSSLISGAQTLGFGLDISSIPNNGDRRIFIRPANNYTKTATVELTRNSDNIFSGEVSQNPDGLYYIYSQTSSSQASLPIYLSSPESAKDIKLGINGHNLSTSLSNDNANKALEVYNSILTDNSINLGQSASKLSEEQTGAILRSYITKSDSVINLAPIPSSVEQFIRIWAYTSASDAYTMAVYLRGREDKELRLSTSEFLPQASSVLDTPIAGCFPNAIGIVTNTLPQGSIEERLVSLNKLYQTPEIREKATAMLMSSFLDSFDYQNKFSEGEKLLETLTRQYSLPILYLNIFRARSASITGTPFPNVTLVDREGNSIDFGKYKGKYVYVDLWASWCGPCVREVPYLQQLEKEMADSNIAFVSISTDSGKAQWLKKMDQLNMHGNQLLDNSGDLTKKLNIRGIPHFLIYDPDGNLYMYNAPRPSNPETKKLLESLK